MGIPTHPMSTHRRCSTHRLHSWWHEGNTIARVANHTKKRQKGSTYRWHTTRGSAGTPAASLRGWTTTHETQENTHETQDKYTGSQQRVGCGWSHYTGLVFGAKREGTKVGLVSAYKRPQIHRGRQGAERHGIPREGWAPGRRTLVSRRQVRRSLLCPPGPVTGQRGVWTTGEGG